MNLTEQPEDVTWPETHYAFVEKVGPFMNTAPQAWQEARAFASASFGEERYHGSA